MTADIVLGDTSQNISLSLGERAHDWQSWYHSTGSFRMDGLQGEFTTVLDTQSVLRFADALDLVHRDLAGQAVLGDMESEPNFLIEVTAGRLGQFSVQGRFWGQPGYQAEISFQIDQSHLPHAARDCRNWVAKLLPK